MTVMIFKSPNHVGHLLAADGFSLTQFSIQIFSCLLNKTKNRTVAFLSPVLRIMANPSAFLCAV